MSSTATLARTLNGPALNWVLAHNRRTVTTGHAVVGTYPTLDQAKTAAHGIRAFQGVPTIHRVDHGPERGQWAVAYRVQLGASHTIRALIPWSEAAMHTRHAGRILTVRVHGGSAEVVQGGHGVGWFTRGELGVGY